MAGVEEVEVEEDVVVGKMRVPEDISVMEPVDVPGVLVADVESEVGCVVGESVELVVVIVSTTVDVSEGAVGDVVVVSVVEVSGVVVVVVWTKVLVDNVLESGA